MYSIYIYWSFEDYQHGHGELIGSEANENRAISLAESSTHGGKTIVTVSKSGTPYMAIINGTKLKY